MFFCVCLYTKIRRKTLSKLKRLSVNIPLDIHQKIRIITAQRNITITTWIMRAVIEKLIRDAKLDLTS